MRIYPNAQTQFELWLITELHTTLEWWHPVPAEFTRVVERRRQQVVRRRCNLLSSGLVMAAVALIGLTMTPAPRNVVTSVVGPLMSWRTSVLPTIASSSAGAKRPAFSIGRATVKSTPNPTPTPTATADTENPSQPPASQSTQAAPSPGAEGETSTPQGLPILGPSSRVAPSSDSATNPLCILGLCLP
ncbi:MAG: hypothetical protein ACREP9_01320 [Candidatus Dormibacteraceae bacterium]